MGKVKKGTIFKIFIITLLIILSTIGFVLSSVKIEQIAINDADDKEYDVYKWSFNIGADTAAKVKDHMSYANSTESLAGLSSLFSQLAGNRDVLCSQHHFPLNDAGGYTANTEYIKGSPAQSYILAQLENQYGEYYESDPVQNAWWSLIYQLGVSGDFLNNLIPGEEYSEFALKLADVPEDAWGEQSPWQESFMMLPTEESHDKTEEELKKLVYDYANKNFKDEDSSEDVDWYKSIEYLLDAFGQSNTRYGSGFVDANGIINTNNLISSINVYGRFLAALEKSGIDESDYAKEYRLFFAADDNTLDKNKIKTAYTHEIIKYDSDGNLITDGKQWTLDAQKVYDVFKYTDERYYELGVDLNYDRRPNAYANMMTNFDKQELTELFLYILQEYSEYTFVGSGYDATDPNPLVDRARAYEEFYEKLKNKSEISIDTTDMKVNKSDELNAFVVGPFVLDYVYGASGSELFGGISEFIVETDVHNFGSDQQIKVGSNKVNEDGKLITNLENGEFALVTSGKKVDDSIIGTTYKVCGNANYAYPMPDEPFYIVFNAGAEDTQITNVGYKYDYLCHKSEYMYYELWYKGVDMQDLAEIYNANLWYQREEINFEIPIQPTIELVKVIPGDEAVTDEFYFDIFVEAKEGEEIPNDGHPVFNHNGVVYKYHTEATVPANGTPVIVALPEYYKSEGQPKVIAVEKDANHNYYGDTETWETTDSLWHDYIPENGTGIYENENGVITAVNIPVEKHYSVEVEKKMLENPTGDTFYAKFDLHQKNENTKTYIVPLKPDGNQTEYPIYRSINPDENGYYVCYTENYEGTEEFGKIVTGTNDDNYIYAKWLHTFTISGKDAPGYVVTEVDNLYLDYYAGKNVEDSIWNKYKQPRYEHSSDIMESDSVSYVGITNTVDEQDLKINLELSKQVQNIEGTPIEDNRNFDFDVIVRKTDKDDDENGTIIKYQTISVPVTNPGEELKVATFDYTIYQVDKDFKYVIIVEERNVPGYEWEAIVQNLEQDGWQAKTDDDGNILNVYYELDNNMTEFSASFTNINTKQEDKHNHFVITKTMKDEEGNDLTDEEIAKYFEKNPDGFTFRVETIRGKELTKSDFDESLQEYITEHNGNIYVTIDANNYDKGVSTNEIYWGIQETAPVYEIYEVDEHDNTYLQYIEMGQNRPLESLWKEFTPNDGGHWTVDFFTQDSEEVVITAINKAGTVEKQFSIAKVVEGTWENGDEFYFRILSLDGKKTNMVEEYFEEEYLTTLKNGLKVVKITQDTPIDPKTGNPTAFSKVLTLSTLAELPQFWVTEVDQYGNPWSETPEKEDSLWNHYRPEHYGTWTCGFSIYDDILDIEITAKNISNAFTLRKEIVTNGEYTTAQFFEEYSNAEFYFRLFDSQGKAVTNKYFDTTSIKTYNHGNVDVIVVNKDNYTGIDSLPITPAAGNKFVLQEVFKTKEEENLYANTEEQLTWEIDFEENRVVEVVAENIAEMTLKIDKVVEGAPDDFLPEEEFYFKVFENNTDVTNDLFGIDIVTIDYTVHQDGGATSRVIYGNHTYEIVEYDEAGKTYEEGKETSEFWQKFTPTNNGIWEVSLGDTKGPSFVEAVNYLTTSITIVKETEGDKDQEFGVSLMIRPSEGTNWMMVDGNYYPTKTSPFYYNHAIKVSANNPYTLDGIYWSGEAPTYQVVEQADTLPDNWSLQGYKVNEQLYSDSPVLSLNGGAVNEFVIVNEEDLEVSIPVSKTIVDQNGNPTTSEADQTFYFDVYVKPIDGAEYKGISINAIPNQEGYASGNYSDDNQYVKIENLAVTIPAGSTNANNSTDIITIPDGTEIEYKVVEVDAPNGKCFADYNSETDTNSYWNKFEPTVLKDGKIESHTGIWTGTLSKTAQTAETANISAYNKVTKVTIDLEKWVWFENELQPIEEGEVFKFIAEYTSSLGREFETETIEITPDNLKDSKTFELLRGEKITYTITEVDPVENTAYDADNLTNFWKQFTPADDPADGLGIITGTVDGSSANIPLTGVNIKNVHGWLAIVKEKDNWLEHEKFYFEVYEGENNVTETLFESTNIVEVNGKNVIELNYNRRKVFSKEQIWKSGTTAPTYTVKEVEYDKEIYTPDSETKTVTLTAIDIDTKLTEDNAATVAGYASFINEEVDYDKFEINKVVKDSQGTIEHNDTFYAIILDKDNENITRDLFDEDNASATIVELGKDKIPAVKLTKDISAITEDIKVTDTGITYTVVEVDCDGYSYADREKTDNEKSVWNNGYEPENGTGIYPVTLIAQENKSALVTSVVTITNLTDTTTEPVKYTISKVVTIKNPDGTETDITNAVFEEGEHFYFKVTDSKGKDVINDLFDNITTITVQNGEEEFEIIDLSKDQKTVITKDIFSDEKYTVTETDQYGVSYSDYTKPEEEPENGWSVWEEYKPSDNKGIWELNKEQTSVIAENEDITRTAHILLSKQTTYDWADGIEYKFNVYIKYPQNKEEPTPIEVILTKGNPTWEKDIDWNVEDGAPSVKVEETNLPEGVELVIKVGDITLQPGEYYELSDKDNVNYTFDCVNNGGDDDDESASFKLLKSALNSETYTFEYEYGYYEDGNWVVIPNTNNELKVVANSEVPAISDTYTWKKGEQAPMFRVWETSGNLESISATNAGTTTQIEVDGHKGIQGTLNSDSEVTIMATNGPEHKGKLKVIKTFDVNKDNLLADLQWLANEYEAKGLDLDDVTFTFNVSISYADKESKFIINGNEHNTWNTSKVWTLPMFIDSFEADSSDNTLTVVPEIEVEWAGTAPTYSVDEIIYSNTFWEHERKVNCSGQLQCACTDEVNCLDEGVNTKTVVAEIINRYDIVEKHKYELLTSLAGDVWIENPLEGKTVEIDGIRYINPDDVASDKFASDVYVIPYKCVVKDGVIVNVAEVKDESGNTVTIQTPRQTNTSGQFILSYSEDYKYLTEEDLGHWEFTKVSVPAFNLDIPEEKMLYENGYTVKYYVDFYYDGMKYMPTDALVDGDAGDYLKLNDDYNKYFDNSVATESHSDRQTYNANFATVEGNELYNNGTSTGIITDEHGNKTTDVDYTTEIAGTIDGSEIIRTTSEGTVKMPISATSSIDEIKEYYMRASTDNLGLRYFFKDLSLGDVSWTLLDVHRSLTTDNGIEKMLYDYEYEKEFVSADYAQHINLGLVEREKADVSIDKKIESVTIIINEKTFTYNYNNDGNFDENLNNAIARFTRTIKADDELYTMLKEDAVEESKLYNIYTSDYYYRSDVYEGTAVKNAYEKFMAALFVDDSDGIITDAIKTKELQIFVTYSITLSNNSIYDVRINSITDYYDSSLTFIDVAAGYEALVSNEQIGSRTDRGPGIWAYIEQDEKELKDPTNIFEKRPQFYNNTFDSDDITTKENLVNAKYKNMIIESDDIRINHNERQTYYVTYRADKADDIVNDILLGTKNNIAEISSFTAFMPDTGYTEYAAVIDKDSAPGNYNINDEISRNIMEDDTDMANVKIDIEPTNSENIRTISGTAWVDKEIEDNNKDGQILGNSIKDENDYLISGLTTKLVEVIDLPVVDDDGNITDQYEEYEFYWEGAETTTNDDGTYVIDSYVPASSVYGNVERPGLVPGNYVIRFFYGDKDTEIYNNNGDQVLLQTQLNGEDYKTTAYQIGLHNENYIDNEWHDLNNERFYEEDNNKFIISDNDARDNEARRLDIISRTQELSNSNTAIFDIANYKNVEEYTDAKIDEYKATIGGTLSDSALEAKRIEFAADYEAYKAMLYGDISYTNGNLAYDGIIDSDDYKMFADTAKLNLKVGYDYDDLKDKLAEIEKNGKNEGLSDEEIKANKDAFEEEYYLNNPKAIKIEYSDDGNVQRKAYKIQNINLGLEERSKTNIYLDKQIKEITLTTSSDKEFFHVEYDILYSTEGGLGWNKVTDNLYVKLEVNKDTLIGENNLQKLDDKFEDAITQGFRYINIESTVLQGLKLDIKYEITAVNLSETDKYGIGLENIMSGNQTFKDAIDALSSTDYVITENNTALLFEDYDGDGFVESPKAYGKYLGHTYYQGFEADELANDFVVTTTVRKVVDYIDNDIEADLALLNEDGAMWESVENSKDALGNLVDKYAFENEDSQIQDKAENPYKTILVSADSKDANSKFVKELLPLVAVDGELIIEVDDTYVLNPEVTATIGISTAKIFAGTDEGRTGMDNFAEILMIENTVGRRDIETVYGNFDPRGGAEQTTERDETATEIVTLSPPTGNLEHDRMMTIVIASICIVAILAGAGVGIKLKISGKSKKSEKTEK